jgi:hypothetical protein
MSTIRSVPFSQAMNQAPKTIIEALQVKGALPKAVTEKDFMDLKSIFKDGSREAKFLSQQLFRFFASNNATISSSGAVVGMLTKAEAALAGSLVSVFTGGDET